MDGPTVGWIGAIVGSAVGIAGAIIGTRHGLREAGSEAERRYILRWAAGCGAGIVAFLAVLAWLPQAYRPLAFIPYALVLVWAIRRSTVQLSRLRAAGEHRPG